MIWHCYWRIVHCLARTKKVLVLRTRTYPMAAMLCQVAVVPQNGVLAPGLALAEEKPAGQTPALKRDFGAINLDRSFEQNRVRIAPEQSADTIQTDRAAALDEITSPCSTLRPRESSWPSDRCDLTESLTMAHSPEDTALPLCQVALPLWATWDPVRCGVDDQHGGHLALVWEDARTRYELCSPYIAGQQLEFTVRHRAGSEKLDERAAQVSALDQAERTARINSGKPLVRLPRYLELEQIGLGMSLDQVMPALPVGQAIIKQNIPEGISVTFAGKLPHDLNMWSGRCFSASMPRTPGQIRFRYAAGSTGNQSATWHKELLAGLKKQGGASPANHFVLEGDLVDLPVQQPAPFGTRGGMIER